MDMGGQDWLINVLFVRTLNGGYELSAAAVSRAHPSQRPMNALIVRLGGGGGSGGVRWPEADPICS